MTTPNDRYLTPEQLRLLIDDGDIDTVVMAFTDMQGRLQGKRLHGRYFLDVALEAGTEGCNYLLAVDIDMNTVAGYAMSSWEQGLRRHGVRPRLVDPSAAHPHAGDGDGAVRPGLARPRARAPVAPHDPAPPARQGRRQGDGRALGHRAGVHRVRHVVRGRPPPRLARPDAGEPVQRRLLDPRHQPDRAAAARHPQPHVRRRARRRGRQGRVQLRAARDRLPVRRRDDDRRQPQRLQDRSQGDRRPTRPGDHVHGEVRPARGQLLPHPPVAARRQRRRRVLGRRPAHAALRPVHRRRAGDAA